jgi:ankyrin repeat protein
MEKDIIKAAKNGDVQKISEILSQHPELIHARDSDDSTPLHCAAWKGHVEVVQLLLTAGADVNLHNKNGHWGTTPLHAAAHGNQAAIAEILIHNGADLNAVDEAGKTPMDHTEFHKAKAAAKIIAKQLDT